jgi:hypothetical protein
MSGLFRRIKKKKMRILFYRKLRMVQYRLYQKRIARISKKMVVPPTIDPPTIDPNIYTPNENTLSLNWTNSARNIKFKQSILDCELCRIDGTWEKNKIKYNPRKIYQNINGKLQWTFDKSIIFFVMNMKKNTERWESISSQLENLKKKYNITYIRVEGVDGNTMENDPSAQEVLKPRENLLGSTFEFGDEKWIYDGTVAKSFPNLYLNGHHGTKGLTISNMKCFELIKTQYTDYNWYCILEDDSQLTDNKMDKIIEIANTSTTDMVLIDERGWGGTCAVMYNQRVIYSVSENMHPLSEFSIHNTQRYNRGANLWDWKLWVYLDVFRITCDMFQVVPSGKFKSEIDV